MPTVSLTATGRKLSVAESDVLLSSGVTGRSGIAILSLGTVGRTGGLFDSVLSRTMPAMIAMPMRIISFMPSMELLLVVLFSCILKGLVGRALVSGVDAQEDEE